MSSNFKKLAHLSHAVNNNSSFLNVLRNDNEMKLETYQKSTRTYNERKKSCIYNGRKKTPIYTETPI